MTEENVSRILYTEGEVEDKPVELVVPETKSNKVETKLEKSEDKKAKDKKANGKKAKDKKANVDRKPSPKVHELSKKNVTVSTNAKKNKKTVAIKSAKRRPDFKFSVLNEWKSRGKNGLKIGTMLTFTKNEKVTAIIQDDGRLLLVAGTEVNGVDDSATNTWTVVPTG